MQHAAESRGEHRRRFSVSSLVEEAAGEDVRLLLAPAPISPTARHRRVNYQRDLPPYDVSPAWCWADWRQLVRGNLRRFAGGLSLVVLACFLLLWWHSRWAEGELRAREQERNLILDRKVDAHFNAPNWPPNASRACAEEEGRECRFLVAGVIKEQETKAQLHLHQLALLAHALNRTLVLPQVSGSRFGTCGKRPFSFYYAPNPPALSGVRTTTHGDFVAWVEEQEEVGVGVRLAVLEQEGARVFERELGRGRFCLLSREGLRWEEVVRWSAPVRFHKLPQEELDALATSLINTLRPLADTPILLTHFSLRHPLLSLSSTPFTHFPPATVWSTLADRMLHEAGEEFMGVHWRVETLPLAVLEGCVGGLVGLLNEVELGGGGWVEEGGGRRRRRVHLATDYPLARVLGGVEAGDGVGRGKANSDTLTKSLTPEHDAIFVRSLEMLRSSGWEVLTFSSLLPADPLPLLGVGVGVKSLVESDSAIPSLVEKILMKRARWFIAGEQGVCGKRSSWTEEVVEARQGRVEWFGGAW